MRLLLLFLRILDDALDGFVDDILGVPVEDLHGVAVPDVLHVLGALRLLSELLHELFTFEFKKEARADVVLGAELTHFMALQDFLFTGFYAFLKKFFQLNPPLLFLVGVLQ